MDRRMARQQGLGEEIANSISHGIGAGLSLAGMALLMVYSGNRGDAWRLVSFSIYGATLFFLYLASIPYHAFQNNRVNRFFGLMDHASIYLLIASFMQNLVKKRKKWKLPCFCSFNFIR